MIDSLIEEVTKRIEEGFCVKLPDGRTIGKGTCKVRIKDSFRCVFPDRF